jgi:hypothetical protein
MMTRQRTHHDWMTAGSGDPCGVGGGGSDGLVERGLRQSRAIDQGLARGLSHDTDDILDQLRQHVGQ